VGSILATLPTVEFATPPEPNGNGTAGALATILANLGTVREALEAQATAADVLAKQAIEDSKHVWKLRSALPVPTFSTSSIPAQIAPEVPSSNTTPPAEPLYPLGTFKHVSGVAEVSAEPTTAVVPVEASQQPQEVSQPEGDPTTALTSPSVPEASVEVQEPGEVLTISPAPEAGQEGEVSSAEEVVITSAANDGISPVEVPALVPVEEVPAGQEEVVEPTSGHGLTLKQAKRMNRAQLLALAEEQGVDVPDDATKSDVIAALGIS
jgi:hypothetical protein